jgi:hypothetical protein
MARPAAIPNAVSGRDTAYALTTVGILTPETAEIVPSLVDGIVGSVAPWRSRFDLFNLIGRASPQRVAGLWDEQDRARLLAVKRRLDPAGLFGGDHAIT